MITEAYCSFEVSKLLKEKGFDEICEMFFVNPEEGYMKNKHIDMWRNSHLREDMICTCPTHQMAMAWLREVHGIYIVFFHTNKSGWWYNITDMRDSYAFYSSEKIMCSYEEVVDLAIKYTLENLI